MPVARYLHCLSMGAVGAACVRLDEGRREGGRSTAVYIGSITPPSVFRPCSIFVIVEWRGTRGRYISVVEFIAIFL